jgi:hypothetical protein
MQRHGTIGQGVRCLVQAAATLIAGAALAGCASFNEKIVSSASDLPGIGLPADAPARPAQGLAYPAVHDMPPPRGTTVLNDAEQQKLEDDLVAARDGQQPGTAQPAQTQKKPQRTGARVIPVSSSRTIY